MGKLPPLGIKRLEGIHYYVRDLERSQTSAFYGALGAVGRVFLEIETEAFTLA